jgi:hypothetical protein
MFTACATVSEASEWTEDNHENFIVTTVRQEWDRKHDIMMPTRHVVPLHITRVQRIIVAIGGNWSQRNKGVHKYRDVRYVRFGGGNKPFKLEMWNLVLGVANKNTYKLCLYVNSH